MKYFFESQQLTQIKIQFTQKITLNFYSNFKMVPPFGN
jgi:hypothetical protein